VTETERRIHPQAAHTEARTGEDVVQAEKHEFYRGNKTLTPEDIKDRGKVVQGLKVKLLIVLYCYIYNHNGIFTFEIGNKCFFR